MGQLRFDAVDEIFLRLDFLGLLVDMVAKEGKLLFGELAWMRFAFALGQEVVDP